MTGLAAGAVIIAMVAAVSDGDTLRMADGLRVRLDGIAAPELSEPGGHAAAELMRSLVNRRWVRCVAAGYRSYDREVMACEAEASGHILDLGAVLQAAGHGRACHVRGDELRYDSSDDRASWPLPGHCR